MASVALALAAQAVSLPAQAERVSPFYALVLEPGLAIVVAYVEEFLMWIVGRLSAPVLQAASEVEGLQGL